MLNSVVSTDVSRSCSCLLLVQLYNYTSRSCAFSWCLTWLCNPMHGHATYKIYSVLRWFLLPHCCSCTCAGLTSWYCSWLKCFRETRCLHHEGEFSICLSPIRWSKIIFAKRWCQTVTVHSIKTQKTVRVIWPCPVSRVETFVCDFTAEHWCSESRKRCGCWGQGGLHGHENWWGLQTIAVVHKQDWIWGEHYFEVFVWRFVTYMCVLYFLTGLTQPLLVYPRDRWCDKVFSITNFVWMHVLSVS